MDQCGEVSHTDKMLADHCRLMNAILGKGWGRLNSKPADMSKAAKEPMAKNDDDRNDCPDEDTSAEVTEETEESNSNETINEDIDAWTASRPTKPNPTTAATKLKLNSKKTSTRPGTRGPTQLVSCCSLFQSRMVGLLLLFIYHCVSLNL
jgi:hypothetical protein